MPQSFEAWYAERAQRLGLNPNPDDPKHFYDYRAAYQAGAEPGPDGHWPSEFKRDGHPNLIVNGINTKTGQSVTAQQEYTVRDKETGKTITFKWNGANAPTDADMAQVFAAARAPQAPAAPQTPVADNGQDIPSDVAAQYAAMKQGQRGPSSPLAVNSGTVGPMLPTAGGIVGGLVGGLPGAAVGGAVGEAARQKLAGESLSLMGMAKEGALMAAGEGIGSLASKGASAGAKWLMGEASRPTMALAREFPDLSQTMLEHALTVSKGGLQQARGLLAAYKATANTALDTAATNGATVPIKAVTDGLMKTFDEVAVNSPDAVGALGRLATLSTQISGGRNAQLTMREADALKTSLQGDVQRLYRQVAAGNGTRGAALEMIAKADMAAALNQAIETIAEQAGAPGYKAANAAAQDMIGATRAISRRLLQPGTSVGGRIATTTMPAVGGAVIAGLPGAAVAATGKLAADVASTPGNLSRAAVYLNHPVVQRFLHEMPKPVMEMIGSVFGITSASGDSSTNQPSQ